MSHRGSRFLNPENSRPAFLSALDFGTDVLETDVRITKDKKLIIFHDKSVERTTNGTGLVNEKTVDEMKTLDIGYHYTADNGKTFPYRGRNTKVMELDEFLKEFFPLNAHINIEIKDDSMEAAEIMWEVLKNHDIKVIQNQLNVISSYYHVLNTLRTLSNDQVPTSATELESTVFIVASKFHLNLIYNPLRRMKTNLFQLPCVAAGNSINLKTKEIVDELHRNGKMIHYWVINDKDTMKEVLKLGADGLITDRTDLAIEVWEELGLKISKKLTREYHLPVDNFVEIYTCTTLLCLFVENISQIVLGAGLVFSILAVMVWHCSGRFNEKLKNE